MAQRRVPEKGGRYAPVGMISPPIGGACLSPSAVHLWQRVVYIVRLGRDGPRACAIAAHY